MKEFITPRDLGLNSPKGTKFIQGLHGVPDFDGYKNTNPEDWYWVEGLPKEKNAFINQNTVDELLI